MCLHSYILLKDGKGMLGDYQQGRLTGAMDFNLGVGVRSYSRLETGELSGDQRIAASDISKAQWYW